LWKGVLSTISPHIAFVAGVFWWEAKHPQLAHSGFMFVYALWPVFVVEIVIFSKIIGHFKASASPDHSAANFCITGSQQPSRKPFLDAIIWGVA
jgi:hypothetical protein